MLKDLWDKHCTIASTIAGSVLLLLLLKILHHSDQIVGDAFVKVWIKDLGLQLTPQQIDSIFRLALENFFLKINADHLSYEWLSEYFSELKRIAKGFVG